MKNYLIGAFLVSLIFANQSFAANARCGLGSKIFGDNKSVLSQVSEIGTNHMFSGDTSISYGTSGCDHDGYFIHKSIGMTQEEMNYASANFEELVIEMAEGRGETLTAFAEALGCSQGVTGEFARQTQENFQSILPNWETTPVEMLYNVKVQIRTNFALDLGCRSAII